MTLPLTLFSVTYRSAAPAPWIEILLKEDIATKVHGTFFIEYKQWIN
jgi:hypothetical protein